VKIKIAHDFFDARNGITTPIFWDTQRLINGHMLIVGSSGVGKSHMLRKMIRRALSDDGAGMGGKGSSNGNGDSRGGPSLRFHVFDVHGDLEVQGASVVQFSESAPFGLNPLRVNPDPHFGGVRKCVRNFIGTINQASTTALGVKQEAVISNLLIDVYRDFGFDIEDPGTWGVSGAQTRLAGGGFDNRLYLDVPFEERADAKAFGARWDPGKKLWFVLTHKYAGEVTRWKPAQKQRSHPTVEDVLHYAQRVYQERYLGTDQKAVLALGYLNKRAQIYHKKLLNAARMRSWNDNGHEFDVEERERLEQARAEAVEAFKRYADSVQTGHELDGLLKYDSPDVLKSVVDRLNNLKRTGIFKDAPAPFDPKNRVWRYKLNAFSQEEKKMFVLFTLQSLFAKAVERGECSDVVEVVVLDELGTYTSSADKEDGDGIIGVICRESRKFGLAFWGATQSPSSVPESLLSSTATKMLLGLDEMYWRSAVDRLRIETKQLEWIQAQKTMAVQMKEKGVLKNKWHWARLED
jgi:hypothetical protein